MSAEEYTPTTSDVRQAWAEEQDTTHGLGYDAHAAEFDRWLAAHDAEVREVAAREVEAKRGPQQMRADETSTAFAIRAVRDETFADAARIIRGGAR